MNNQNTTAKKPAWKFFRSEMATMVWDTENDCILAEFEKGVFTTEDKRVATILRERGYIEIPLNADKPPETVKVMPAPVQKGNIPVMTAGMNAAPDILESKMSAVVDIPQVTGGVTVHEGAPVIPTRVRSN